MTQVPVPMATSTPAWMLPFSKRDNVYNWHGQNFFRLQHNQVGFSL